MNRKKRWEEDLFIKYLRGIIYNCMLIAYVENCNIANGFALCMEKLQDQEIKRH
jgi:hypothetical protein